MSRLESILVAANAGDELKSVDKAELVSGMGIVGDRYYKKIGTFSEGLAKSGDFEVTLIESEQIDSFNLETSLDYQAKDFRRNLVTSGVSLEALVGVEFKVGNVVLKAVRLCEPCKYLSDRLGEVVMRRMMGKCGIRAVIIEGGEINVGNRLSAR